MTNSPSCTGKQLVLESTAASFDHWRQLVAQSFVPLDTEARRIDSFRGTLSALWWDRVSIVEVKADAHEVHRTPTLIGQDGKRYFKLNVQLEGTGLLVQGNREALLTPGDMAIYDTSRPYTLAFEQRARTVVLMFPHDALSLSPAHIGQLSAARMAAGSGMTRLVAPFLTELAGNFDTLSGPSGTRLAMNTLDLVSTLLHAELDLTRDALSPQSVLLQSVHSFIEENLHDRELSPASIARAHFISTRHLHHVFQASGTTIASWIKSQRLDRAARDLHDPLLAGESVSAIASRWGFSDAPYFSRAFREAFEESPSAWRCSS